MDKQSVALESQALLAEASRRSAGLAEFGDPSFRAGLEVLLRSVNEEAQLSDAGRALFAERIVESLCNRLTLEAYCARHPEILNEAIERPVVIVGLPRTGTTMLHRILARDPRFYTANYWEVRFPSPFPGAAPDAPDPRIAAAKTEVGMMIQAMPELLAMHPLDAELPDEEVILMEHSFLSAMDAYANLPGYVAWLGRQDQTPAYAYLKRQLQFLQWQKRQRGEVAQRWILKSPHHVHAMPTLFKVFPDVQVIQTHRDPLQTIPSMGSFAYTIWRVYSDVADPAKAGRLWADKFAAGMRNSMAFRDGMPAARFLDVWYLDAVTKPIEVAESVYPFLGMELGSEVRQRMLDWMELSRRDQRAAHQYSIEKMGLTLAGLERDFAGYRARYILPRQAGAAA
ncbi:sulfotransferase family protein [Pseudoduganella namucuonensis]|uniref:Sulfotransferase family protein n=1 Tax=Pseudoduganella namucuonensis TaxID=1035707 RepID=A0A1I7M5S0_9BURK|nr:sulfotransferase [Pseudoduganella namucuonensis]SFV17302.1 Sulfotransferase family protein [Pseudoduganella namucuonensis]